MDSRTCCCCHRLAFGSRLRSCGICSAVSPAPTFADSVPSHASDLTAFGSQCLNLDVFHRDAFAKYAAHLLAGRAPASFQPGLCATEPMTPTFFANTNVTASARNSAVPRPPFFGESFHTSSIRQVLRISGLRFFRPTSRRLVLQKNYSPALADTLSALSKMA